MRKLFLATASNGKLDWGSPTNESMLRESLKASEGKTWRLELPEVVRSNQQNRFYWLYLGVISQETGDDINSLHEYFKRAFLTPKFIKVLGKEVKIPASTTDLSKADFGEYLDRICGECEVPIPDPELAGFTGYKYK